MRQIALTLMLAAIPGTLAAAEPMTGNPAEGQRFAREVCAECHDVEPGGMALLGPPAFAEIAADPKMTETALRAFLQTSHIEMPNFILPAEQTDDLIAYILGLRADQAAD